MPASLPRSAVNSPPLCGGNKMAATAAARTRCARSRSPPHAAPRPAAAPRAGGARAPGPRPPPPGGRALSVAASWGRAHVPGAHTPSGPELRGGATPLPHSLLLSYSLHLFVPVPPPVPGESQVPEAGNVASFVLTGRGEADPSLEAPSHADCRGSLCGFVGFPNL